MRARLAALLILAGGLGAPTGGAMAQNPASPPTPSVEVALDNGFGPRPDLTAVTAGGTVAAATRMADCKGYVSETPSLRLVWTDRGETLSRPVVSVVSNADAVLLIRGPGGDWSCDDDSGEDNNPSLVLTGASGVYEIWAGVYNEGERKLAVVTITPDDAP